MIIASAKVATDEIADNEYERWEQNFTTKLAIKATKVKNDAIREEIEKANMTISLTIKINLMFVYSSGDVEQGNGNSRDGQEDQQQQAAEKQFQELPKESTFYFRRKKRTKKQHKQEGERITNSGTIQKQGKRQEGRPKT